MAKKRKFQTWHEVLRYGSDVSQSTLRTYYRRYREEHGLPARCDMPGCPHPDSASWNGAPLCLILDHVEGVNKDNRPDRLRYLCPNCNAQQATHGGGNKGKVKMSAGGFATLGGAGKWNYVLPVETGTIVLTGNDVGLHAPQDAG
jgi:hypothetical protein